MCNKNIQHAFSNLIQNDSRFVQNKIASKIPISVKFPACVSQNGSSASLIPTLFVLNKMPVVTPDDCN